MSLVRNQDDLSLPPRNGDLMTVHRSSRTHGPHPTLLTPRFSLNGVESGRGRNPTLSVRPMTFDDVGDGVLADAEVTGNPTVAPPPVDGMEHLWGEAV